MTSSRLVAIALAFGLGSAVMGSVTLPTSGGHLNPSISFAMVVSGRLTLVAGICYTVGQSIGAIVGVLCVSAAIPNEFHVSIIYMSYVTLTSSATKIIQTGSKIKESKGIIYSLEADSSTRQLASNWCQYCLLTYRQYIIGFRIFNLSTQ